MGNTSGFNRKSPTRRETRRVRYWPMTRPTYIHQQEVDQSTDNELPDNKHGVARGTCMPFTSSSLGMYQVRNTISLNPRYSQAYSLRPATRPSTRRYAIKVSHDQHHMSFFTYASRSSFSPTQKTLQITVPHPSPTPTSPSSSSCNLFFQVDVSCDVEVRGRHHFASSYSERGMHTQAIMELSTKTAALIHP